MGIFHLSCPASGLGIVVEDVQLVLVASAGKKFVPVAPPIGGTYDSFGCIVEPNADATSRDLIQAARDLKEKKQLGVEGTGNLEGDPAMDDLVAFFNDVRQGQVDETWVRAMDRRLGYVLVLDDIFDAAVKATRRLDPARAETLANGSWDALLDAAFGSDALARALAVESPEARRTLVEFVLFRTWFDAGSASWTPEANGNQYFPDDLRDMVQAARERLSAWPELLSAVELYEAAIDDDDDDDEHADDDDDDDDDEDDDDDDEEEADDDEEEADDDGDD